MIRTGTASAEARRPRARRGEGEKLREQILDAAEKLLLEAGSHHGVSVRAIAERCGVTPPAIYLHFADKEELFLEVGSRRFRELGARMEEAGRNASDPLDELRLRGLAYVNFGLEHPEAYALLMMPRRDGRRVEPSTAPARDALSEFVAAVARAAEAGVLDDLDPHQAGVVLWAAIHGVTSLMISFPDFEWGDKQALIEHLSDVLIEGVLSA